MLRDLLNLENLVQIRRITETYDGYGATTTSTTLTTISRTNIWQASSNDARLSDKITSISTHVLAMEYGEYAFTDSDREVIYNSETYEIVGHDDDVGNRRELCIVGLKRTS